MQSGLPALRHDWFFPESPLALPGLVAWYADGWSPFGLGSPQPYPTFYPLVLILWPLCHFVSPALFVGVVVMVTQCSAAWCGAAIARIRLCSKAGEAAAAFFAACNPWVFTEYVAGHIYMVLAYAVILGIIAELLRATPRKPMLTIFAVLSILQIEFFAIIAVPLFIWFATMRQWRSLCMVIIAAAPITFGILANYGQIRNTPFGLDWETWESVPLQLGVLMRGYGQPYDQAFASVLPASIYLAIIALVGIVLCCLRGELRWIAFLTLACLCYATGLQSFLAPVFSYIILHIPESGIFRELYDLIGLTAIGFCVFLTVAIARYPILQIPTLIAAGALIIPWITNPVAAQTLPRSMLPNFSVPGDTTKRVAFFPATQPLAFEGRGSGTDPDCFPAPGTLSPLNEWFPTFPVDAAFTAAANAQSYDNLASLGVSRVIMRRDYKSDSVTINQQGVAISEAPAHALENRMLEDPIPLISLATQKPKLVLIGDQPSENAEFFGDEEPTAITRLRPSVLTHNPQKAWIDARQAARINPAYASAFGGVYTQAVSPLAIPPSVAALATVHGVLTNEHGSVVARDSDRPQWFRLPANTGALLCHGTCMVALLGKPPARMPEHAFIPRAAWHTLQITMPHAWWFEATLPARAAGTLRLNNRFDSHWIAYADHTILPHVRLDTAVNGWILTPSPNERKVVLIEIVATGQAMLELLAFVMLSVFLIADANEGLRRSARKTVSGR